MNRTALILIKPLAFTDDNQYEIGGTESHEDFVIRKNEYKRVKAALAALGFVPEQGRAYITAEWCNIEQQAQGKFFTISPSGIDLLEGRAADLAQARKQAMAKLTPAEQHALGLLAQP